MNYIQAFVRARDTEISCITVRPRGTDTLEIWLCAEYGMLKVDGLTETDFHDNQSHVLNVVSEAVDQLQLKNNQ